MLSGRVGRRADANIGFVAFTAKAELTFRPTSNLVKILLCHSGYVISIMISYNITAKAELTFTPTSIYYYVILDM